MKLNTLNSVVLAGAISCGGVQDKPQTPAPVTTVTIETREAIAKQEVDDIDPLPKPAPKKLSPREQILKEAPINATPTQSADKYNEIEKFRRKTSKKGKPGWEVIRECDEASSSQECREVWWQEEEKLLKENEGLKRKCDESARINQWSDDQWFDCLDRNIYRYYPDLHRIRYSCYQRTLECVEAQF